MAPPRKSKKAAGTAAEGQVDGYTPVSVEIAGSVRELILSGRLGPGERIRQHELATDYGVSRLPVREALRQLENEGLVVQVPHSGARVSSISLAECAELYTLREALEPAVLAQSVPNLTAADVEELELCLGRLEAVNGDVAAWLMQDRLFHLGSFQACGMPTGLNLVERFYNQTQPFRRSYYGALDEAKLKVVHLEHRLLFDAIARKDPGDAHAYQRSHIRRTRLELMSNPALAEPAAS